jgi:TRAP-type C4-dicarboxylate transport system permease small subunit
MLPADLSDRRSGGEWNLLRLFAAIVIVVLCSGFVIMAVGLGLKLAHQVLDALDPIYAGPAGTIVLYGMTIIGVLGGLKLLLNAKKKDHW